MEIAVIGTGYVGLVTGGCLSELGNNVTCIDIDEDKVATLKQGISPIYEDGLTELLQKNIENGNLHFTTDYKTGLSDKSLVYIAVGTPQGEDGSADLTYINTACESIARDLANDVVIVTKSTVPVGTNEYIKDKIETNLEKNITVKIASNPEFLRQGSAVHDTFNADRIVIGSDDEEALQTLEKANADFNLPIVKTDLRSAEMIKYASNAFLATKISFINEMANLSEKIGANIDHVAKGMGMDARIGNAFLNAGIGYGGSCFPKDTRAIISIGKDAAYDMPILENVVESNDRQRGILVDKILERYETIKGKKVAVLGLAFKPNTDDMREAPSILVTEKLLVEGAIVNAYDPVASDNAKKILPEQINYTSSIEEAVEDADITIILTEWKEIKAFPLEHYKKHMTNAVIFDGRNCFELEGAAGSGVEYHSIGRPTVNG
ncbi:UDPglucose 6-dehydrogenase [Virgibacillus natechei]|uniref:UDP-glucose 6-dehydrogenase n=1 Tax=Virgibacillus natechei TaxID=1216297 RepID=A0ABS4IKP1_9BACI|nr:UDP-glucose/GDP-mannose dehydrogenase family protein [Virgibacillus natechei]MBP1971489.1 UDPglucose 6-dehydrogenase [Virgibacillus natechei]UZD12543.1 UDP-glucose/GDP-mannose dehydrogenase family protein [Virgibacillus natechei]